MAAPRGQSCVPSSHSHQAGGHCVTAPPPSHGAEPPVPTVAPWHQPGLGSQPSPARAPEQLSGLGSLASPTPGRCLPLCVQGYIWEGSGALGRFQRAPWEWCLLWVLEGRAGGARWQLSPPGLFKSLARSSLSFPNNFLFSFYRSRAARQAVQSRQGYFGTERR